MLGGGQIPLQRGQQGGGNTYNITVTVPTGPMTQEQFMRYMADVARRVYQEMSNRDAAPVYGGSPTF
jgi:hypothetical protein